MGQKVHPTGMRLGIVETHRSVWYAPDKKSYSKFLFEDIKIREMVRVALKAASVGRIQIERLANNNVLIVIHVARPAVAIGRKGEDIEKLKASISAFVGLPVQVAVEQIARPELDARLVADMIAELLEKRVMFRRAIKRAVSNAMRLGAKGVKVAVSGRLGGAEIARREWVREGRVPLHTLRANIDYAVGEAATTYGIIGVKVWIFKGEVTAKAGSTEELAG